MTINDSLGAGWVDGFFGVQRNYEVEFLPRPTRGTVPDPGRFYEGSEPQAGLTYVEGTEADYDMGYAQGRKLRAEAEELRSRVESGDVVSPFEAGRYEAFSLGVPRIPSKESRADNDKYLGGRESILLPAARHPNPVRLRWVRTDGGYRLAGWEDNDAAPL